MAWKIRYTDDAQQDLRQIFRHLLNSHLSFGRTTREARDLARIRLAVITDTAKQLGRTPMIGTRQEEVAAGLRHVTFDRAVYWFQPDEADEVVVIRAVFHGGQDHLNHMLDRIKVRKAD